MPDPKLKTAIAEIRNVFKNHDIGGYIVLVSQSHAEFGYELDPSWSCAYWENKNIGALRFRAKEKEIGKRRCKELVESTTHMICQIRDLCGLGFKNMQNCINLLETQIKIDHTSFHGFEPHTEPEKN